MDYRITLGFTPSSGDGLYWSLKTEELLPWFTKLFPSSSRIEVIEEVGSSLVIIGFSFKCGDLALLDQLGRVDGIIALGTIYPLGPETMSRLVFKNALIESPGESYDLDASMIQEMGAGSIQRVMMRLWATEHINQRAEAKMR